MSYEKKYTPGPWEASDEFVYIPSGEDGINTICEVWLDRGAAENEEQLFANAQLIAESPNLLETLIDCLVTTTEIAIYLSGKEYPNLNKIDAAAEKQIAMGEKIQAAIERVLGKSQ